MPALEIPNELRGAWDHGLFVTYPLHVSFLEHGLWRQLRGVRNRVVLADGKRFLDTCQQLAAGDVARRLNHQYVAGGIFCTNTAHAKFILLTDCDEGRLLVGSGNLGLPGYTSGGEIFTKYEYPSDDEQVVSAFVAVREFIEGLMDRDYVEPLLRERLTLLLEETPWLFRSSSGPRPVRHNLAQSHLSQMTELVGSQRVEELWILTPFFDRQAVALGELLKALKPKRAILLVQPGRTSIDPGALKRVMRRNLELEVRPFERKGHDVYVHAKLYLAKLRTRAVCLQGSPNLSQVAMLRTDPDGNLEMANLVEGRRDDFDHLFAELDIDDAADDLDDLDLSFEEIDEETDGLPGGWSLTGGEWRKNDLWLDHRGDIPDLRKAEILVGDETRPCRLLDVSKRRVHMRIDAETQELLQRPVPIRLRWKSTSETSNPVFIGHLGALDASMAAAEATDRLARVGDLSLEDEELEELVLQLEKALIIDNADVWRLTGRPAPSNDIDEEDESFLDYGSIDYEALKRHPKLLQYSTGFRAGGNQERSRLQIVLSGITQQFLQHIDPTIALEEAARAVAKESSAEQEDVEAEEELDEVHERKRLKAEQRIRRILKGFIRRYLRGIRSHEFQNAVGYEVIVQNYLIFAHILWRLMVTERVDDEFLIDATLQMWELLWGTERQSGYLEGLESEERDAAVRWLRKHHHASTMLATLYYAGYVAQQEDLLSLLFRLRNLARRFLSEETLEVSAPTLDSARELAAQAFLADPPTYVDIVDELEAVVDFETEDAFLDRVCLMHGLTRERCSFEKQTVYKESAGRSAPVDCLVIGDPSDALTKIVACSLLAEWMSFEPDLEYFRIAASSGGRLMFDVPTNHAWWLAKRGDDLEDLGVPPQKADSGHSELLAKARKTAERRDRERGLTGRLETA